MRRPWFREVGLLYLPIRPHGWNATAAALAFCTHIVAFVDSRAHSVSDTLYGAYPFVVPTLLALYILALRTSERQE